MRRRRGSLPVSGLDAPLRAAPRQGLSSAQIEGMRAAQHGACAICGSPLGPGFAVDHDHALARLHGHPEERGCPRCVRGLLCRGCNLMLGNAEDSPATLRAGADYLDRSRRRR